jgi:hypothetical protein
MRCHRTRTIEADGFGNMPRSVRRQWSTEKEREKQAWLRTRHPPHSTRPSTGNWLECWLAEGGRGQQGGAAARFLKKNHQKVCQNVSFWGHVINSKRLGRHFCRDWYFWVKLSYFISFPAIWGQSRQGQIWPHMVQLVLRIILHLHCDTQVTVTVTGQTSSKKRQTKQVSSQWDYQDLNLNESRARGDKCSAPDALHNERPERHSMQ